MIEAVAAGSTGYLQKYSPPEELAKTVTAVAGGQLRIPEGAVRRFFAMIRGKQGPYYIQPLDRLTELERDTLTSFAKGESYVRIAEEKGKSPVTVRNTLFRVQNKLGIGTKQELVIWAVRDGLVDGVEVGVDPERTE